MGPSLCKSMVSRSFESKHRGLEEVAYCDGVTSLKLRKKLFSAFGEIPKVPVHHCRSTQIYTTVCVMLQSPSRSNVHTPFHSSCIVFARHSLPETLYRVP